jgi:hypothetical protein
MRVVRAGIGRICRKPSRMVRGVDGIAFATPRSALRVDVL